MAAMLAESTTPMIASNHVFARLTASNENEVSYRHRRRAVLEVKMAESSENVNAGRVAVSSTDWLDDWRDNLTGVK